MPRTPRKPPASATRTKGESPSLAKTPALRGDRPSWPTSSACSQLRPEFKRLRDDLLTAAHVSRGTIVADIGLADAAAMAAQTQSQWFAISQKIIQEGNAKNTPPDIKSLSTASSRAEAAGRNYRSAIEALGLKGAEFGAVRAQKVNAVAGVISDQEEWDDV